MKTKIDAEVIQICGTFTIKVYVPSHTNSSCEKVYFTKDTYGQAYKAARAYFKNTSYETEGEPQADMCSEV